MFKLLSIFLLLFSACSFAPKKTPFHMSDLILAINIDHKNQTVSECEILLPYQEKTKEILSVYYKLDKNNQLLYSSEKKVSFLKDRTEYILFNILGEDSLAESKENCNIIFKYYNESLGFTKI